MGHYNIKVSLTKEEVSLLKDRFTAYLEKAGAIRIEVATYNDVPDPPKEVIEVLQKVFLRVIMQANRGTFEGLN